jgi:hypothetical protein
MQAVSVRLSATFFSSLEVYMSNEKLKKKPAWLALALVGVIAAGYIFIFLIVRSSPSARAQPGEVLALLGIWTFLSLWALVRQSGSKQARK